MLKEATEVGFYHSEGWNRDYPKIQILTVEELQNGKTVNLPPSIATFEKADKAISESRDQAVFDFNSSASDTATSES